jgi:ABC-type uncharacterized transport system permease subunit
MTAFFLATAVLYAAASLGFLLYLLRRKEEVLRLARLVLLLALAVHLGFIGFQCTRGMNPLRDVRGALGLSGWLVSVGYLVATLRSRFGVIGVLLAPLSLGLLVTARLTPPGSVVPGMEASPQVLGRVHIALAALGVAIFGIAAAVAMIYLFQETALRHKRVGGLSRRAPSLSNLDDAVHKLILVGFPVFTLALITGLIWIVRLPLQGGFRPEHAIAALTWSVFAVLIVARSVVGLRGRRAAILTVLGFAATVTVLLVYMGRRMLGG